METNAQAIAPLRGVGRLEENGAFRYRFIVPQPAIDENGHVNNVAYLQWMQDAAICHSSTTGGTQAAQAAGCFWVVRSHQLEYRSPAFAGDQIEVITWVATCERLRSLRRYVVVRLSDQKLLAQGQTDWVFVKRGSGRPTVIPDSVRACYAVLGDYDPLKVTSRETTPPSAEAPRSE